MKFLVVTYSRDASIRPVAIRKTDTIKEAKAFIREFDKRKLPLATEIVEDKTEDGTNG